MKQRPTKAIIPVAGYGTRRLPITKSIEKCMLPILNRPLIDYIVEDCKAAGVTEIIFVVSGGAEQLKSYYQPHQELEEYLKANNKLDELNELSSIGEGMTFHYVEQPRDVYGTAVPVWVAREHISDGESFVVLMGDDFIVRHDGTSSVAALIDSWQQSDAEHALLAVEVPLQDVSKYGVLLVGKDDSLDSIVEKPSVETAPSTLINVSKYIFGASILENLASYMETERNGEYMITDVVSDSTEQGRRFAVVPAHGAYLDGGTVEGWLHANSYIANL